MKLIVFGGTGKTGLAVIERAVQVESNIVTVYARRPNRIPAHLIEKIKIIKGDVLDAEAVKNSLQGQDVVISCLGKGLNLAPTTLISEGTKNVLDGMIFHKIKRIFVVSICKFKTNLSKSQEICFQSNFSSSVSTCFIKIQRTLDPEKRLC